MNFKTLAVASAVLFSSCLQAGKSKALDWQKYLPIFAFNQFSDMGRVKDQLSFPKNNPSIFSANEKVNDPKGDFFMLRHFYALSDKVKEQDVKDLLSATNYKESIGMVPKKFINTQKALTNCGYKLHKEGNPLIVMRFNITSDRVKQAKKNIEEFKNKGITVRRATNEEGLKIWVDTAVNAFKDMFGLSKYQIESWVAFVLKNIQKKKYKKYS